MICDIYVANYAFDTIIELIYNNILFYTEHYFQKKSDELVFLKLCTDINKIFTKYNSDVNYVKDYFYIINTILLNCINIINKFNNNLLDNVFI